MYGDPQVDPVTTKAIHGTATRYRYGCRCDLCRDANATRQRGYRQGASPGTDIVNIDDLLTQCWCQNDYVYVPPSDIRELRTRSCGATGCQQEAS
jgi:hypothetical protein